MAADINKTSVTKAYNFWAPFYDLVFGSVFEQDSNKERHVELETMHWKQWH